MANKYALIPYSLAEQALNPCACKSAITTTPAAIDQSTDATFNHHFKDFWNVIFDRLIKKRPTVNLGRVLKLLQLLDAGKLVSVALGGVQFNLNGANLAVDQFVDLLLYALYATKNSKVVFGWSDFWNIIQNLNGVKPILCKLLNGAKINQRQPKLKTLRSSAAIAMDALSPQKRTLTNSNMDTKYIRTHSPMDVDGERGTKRIRSSSLERVAKRQRVEDEESKISRIFEHKRREIFTRNALRKKARKRPANFGSVKLMPDRTCAQPNDLQTHKHVRTQNTPSFSDSEIREAMQHSLPMDPDSTSFSESFKELSPIRKTLKRKWSGKHERKSKRSASRGIKRALSESKNYQRPKLLRTRGVKRNKNYLFPTTNKRLRLSAAAIDRKVLTLPY